jgi:hypothetical protein
MVWPAATTAVSGLTEVTGGPGTVMLRCPVVPSPPVPVRVYTPAVVPAVTWTDVLVKLLRVTPADGSTR